MGTPLPLPKPLREERVYSPALSRLALPLEELLVSGGDHRLAVADKRNAYGCAALPQLGMLDFASSTASTVSLPAFAAAQAAQFAMWRHAARIGPEAALDQRLEQMRETLRRLWGAQNAEIIFSPSGTDAQLQALFLAKALLGAPLATIIVGADQTGSGTVHTAQGFHFADCVSSGQASQKGAPVRGLSDGVRTIAIDFCDQAGCLRSDDAMDRAVQAAVADAIARGEKVLLQAMASSKLGWCGPSDACLAAIGAAWPDAVLIVVDACQMRLGRAQLADYLARGYLVLATGSKFFAGPPFSGALLVPETRAEAIDRSLLNPDGLCDYATLYDWPLRWQHLRRRFSPTPNYGQWLRWEAALAEIEAYHAVPLEFRDALLQAFAAQASQLFAAFPALRLMAERCGALDPNAEMRHRTIFAFVPHRNEEALSAERCAALYRTAGRDGFQVGQPVALRHRAGAALRLCISARLVAQAWERGRSVEQSLAALLADARAVLEKLDGLIESEIQ